MLIKISTIGILTYLFTYFSFITVKAHCLMTQLKQQKSVGLNNSSSTPLGHGCNVTSI